MVVKEVWPIFVFDHWDFSPLANTQLSVMLRSGVGLGQFLIFFFSCILLLRFRFRWCIWDYCPVAFPSFDRALVVGHVVLIFASRMLWCRAAAKSVGLVHEMLVHRWVDLHINHYPPGNLHIHECQVKLRFGAISSVAWPLLVEINNFCPIIQ